MAREAVRNGFVDEFATIVGLDSKPKLAKKMFDLIKKRMAA
jgi:hypothetical protein